MTTIRARVIAVITLVVVASGAAPRGESNRRPTSTAFALSHVRVVDGTGGPAKDDQTIVVSEGRIRAVGSASAVRIPQGTETIDLAGRTAIPGLVGMHDHLFYQLAPEGSGEMTVRAGRTFATLYLAAGVTTIRTTGTVDLRADARLKARIDAGNEPGPRIVLTGRYLNAETAQPDPDRIANEVNEDADAGATWAKAYTTLRSSELKAAIAAAHARGVRVTGHLCAVGFREAASLGIDNVEHGLFYDTELFSGKRADECPDQSQVFGEILDHDVGDSDVWQTINALVRHGVALTSTLAVLDSFTGNEATVDSRVKPLLSSRLVDAYESAVRTHGGPKYAWWGSVVRKEMAFERAFVAAGGRLVAGVDPTGWGGVVAGFGNQREVELLVRSGFAPEKAIQIATANGARLLLQNDLGTIGAGARADIVVLNGNPIQDIRDIRNVETVLKDGVAYDPNELIASIQATLGAFDYRELPPWMFATGAVLVSTLVVVRVRKYRKRVLA